MPAPGPSSKPVLFAEGVVSTHLNELNATLSSDGNRFVYTVASASASNTYYTLFETMRRNGQWTKPAIVPFSGQYSDADPFFSPDGTELYFISYRPVQEGQRPKQDFDMWAVAFTGASWGKPRHLGSVVNSDKDELYPAVTRNGTLYYSTEVGAGANKYDVLRANKIVGGWAPPESIGSSINTTATEYDAYVAPDESYLIFTAIGRPDGLGSGDLYISYHHDGVWGPATNLGPTVNTPAMEQCPAVSPNGKTLFFTSLRETDFFTGRRKLTTKDYLKAVGGPLNGLGNIFWMDAAQLKEK